MALLCSGVWAQEQLRFNRLTQEDGLRQGLIQEVVQDPMGFLWIATKGGLHRYDGSELIVYNHRTDEPDSLHSDNVIHIEPDSRGNLWVINRNHLPQYFKQRTESFHSLPERVNRYFQKHLISSLIYDDRGYLWLLTLGHGLHLYSIEEQRAAPVLIDYEGQHLLREDLVTTETLLLENGSLLVPIPQGHLLIEDPLGERKLTLSKVPDLPNFSVREYQPDADGSILFLMDDRQVYRLSPDLKSAELLEPEGGYEQWPDQRSFTSMLIDNDGTLWLGSAAGLVRWQRPSGRISEHRHDPANRRSLVMNQVAGLYQDRSETLWILSTGRGLSSYSKFNNKFSVYQQFTSGETTGEFVYALAVNEREVIWAGLGNGQIVQIDTRSNTRLADQVLRESETGLGLAIRAIHILNEDMALVASAEETYLVDAANPARTRSITETGILGFIEDSAGRLWGYGNGLYAYDFERQELTGVPLPDLHQQRLDSWEERIRDCTEIDGRLMLATQNGNLLLYDPDSGDVEDVLPPNHTIRSGSRIIHTVHYCDIEHTIWLGTDAGLYAFNLDTGGTSSFSVASGLPDNTIYGILVDPAAPDVLWCSTNQGLFAFNTQTAEHTDYTTADGLPSNEFNRGAYAASAGSQLYFGGVSGFICFNPGELESNPYPPPLAITAIRSFDREVPTKTLPQFLQSISLDHSQNFFSLEFAALDFAFPANNRYRYRLTGFQEQWVESGTNQRASYTNVPPGTYTFMVQGSNNDGVWNTNSRHLKLTIVPPFWQTTPFYLLIGLAVLAAIAGGHWYRTATIVRQRNLLSTEVEERRKAEQRLLEHQKRLRKLAAQLAIAEEKERRRIAIGMHDTVGQNLAFAKRLINDLRNSESLDGKLQEGLQEARDLLSESIHETKHLTFELSPPVLYELGFVSALHWLADNLLKKENIAWRVESDQNTPDLPINVAVLLFQCVRETLVNIVKHARATSVVIEISALGSAGIQRISIIDDGIGFDPEEKSSEQTMGFGLFSLNERIGYLGGTATIESDAGRGTAITFAIPQQELEPGSEDEGYEA